MTTKNFNSLTKVFLELYYPNRQSKLRIYEIRSKLISRKIGSVAEWSKALVLGTSHFGGVGSNLLAHLVLQNMFRISNLPRNTPCLALSIELNIAR